MPIRSSLIKLTIFVVISVASTFVVISTLINPVNGATADYTAVLTDATGLVTGSDVQISGVRIGRVQGVSLVDNHAVVDFQIQADQRIPVDGLAVVRYADLLGSRPTTCLPAPRSRYNAPNRRWTSPRCSTASGPCSMRLIPPR